MNENRNLIKTVLRSDELEKHVEVVKPSSNGNYGYGVETEGEVHLRDYWRSVRKHLWLVIGVTLLITMLAAVYVARKPDLFESQARVQVDLENNPAVGLGSKAGSVIVNSPGTDPAYFNTQLQILTGPGLLRRVVRTLDLERNQDFLRPKSAQSGSTWQNLKRMVGMSRKPATEQNAGTTDELQLTTSVASATSRDDLVEAKRLAPFVLALQIGLKVEPVMEKRTGYKDTRLIDIRFTHPDPNVAAKIVNAMADTFVLSNLEQKSQSKVIAGEFLQRRVAELQAQIRNGEERLINYAKSNQILSLDASQNTVVDRLTGLNKQLLEAENERKLAEAAYRAALAPGAAEAMAESSAPQVVGMESKLVELRQRRAQLLVENTEEWPEVKELDGQIAELEKQAKETRKRASSVVLTNLKTNYEKALSLEQGLLAAFNKQRGETLTQNEAAINYRIIQQEIETNKGLLDGLLQRFKENDVVRAETFNNIHVVDYAVAPTFPVGPNRLRTVVAAFVLALALGIGLALFLEYIDDSLRTADDVEQMLHLPALALIPAVNSSTHRRLLPAGAGLQLRNGNGHHNSPLLLDADARAPLAEAYRQLRTSVLLSTAGRPPKTLLVTSSMPGEGKTTTAINMAISLAQTNATVLILDADMRRPRVHSVFGVENQRGLSTLLSSETNEVEILNLIQHDDTSGLYILTSGRIPPNPAELIGSAHMERLLEILERTFTHVVIDSPPTASFTDSVLLASLADGVLLVVHGGKSSRDVVKRSRRMLQDVGAKIVGVVINNVKLRSHDYYYYKHYYAESYAKVESDNAISGA